MCKRQQVAKMNSWKCGKEEFHPSKSNFPQLLWTLWKTWCASPVFLLGRGLKSINPPSINFITCFLLLGHPETPKGKLLVLRWKIVLRKRNYSDRLNPLFSLSIKRATRPTVDVRAARAARVRSRAHKQSHVSRQTDCSLQPPRHPDKNRMF